MKTKNSAIQFGEKVEGFNIPVLNEREIRAAAGILFLLLFISIMIVIFNENFLMLKYMISIFMLDMSIRVFVSPKYSPLLVLGRLIVNKQSPIYVGAPQKKFAWIIGLILSSTIFYLLVVVNSFSPFMGIICMTCLIFLFFETAFGICVGCKIYSLFYKEKTQYCPGEICDPKLKHDIQKTSGSQIVMLIGLIAFILILLFFFNDIYSKSPDNLWEIMNIN